MIALKIINLAKDLPLGSEVWEVLVTKVKESITVARAKSAKKSAESSNALFRYFRQTRGEVRKVTWPTRKESQRLTAIVLGVTAVMALFLGILDYVFSNLIQEMVRVLIG